jgi:hypothetical protein
MEQVNPLFYKFWAHEFSLLKEQCMYLILKWGELIYPNFALALEYVEL